MVSGNISFVHTLSDGTDRLAALEGAMQNPGNTNPDNMEMQRWFLKTADDVLRNLEATWNNFGTL